METFSSETDFYISNNKKSLKKIMKNPQKNHVVKRKFKRRKNLFDDGKDEKCNIKL